MAVEESQDVFKEPPLRYLGYANEVGEAFRHCVPVRVVHLTYLLASGYVLAHATSRGYHWTDQGPSHHATPTHAAADTLVWQGLASVVIPGAAINRVCWAGRWALRGLRSPALRRWGVVALGLSVIPFIIQPIDRLVDRGMDSVRPSVKRLLTKGHSSTPVL